MVEVSRDATERRLSANQATTRRRQRNFRSGDVLRVQRWRHYRTYIESSKGLDVRFKDDFEGIDWKRLSGFIAPLRTYKHKKSWIYRYGYRVPLASDPSQIWFICKYCHQHKRIDCGKAGKYNTTKSTSAAAAHLEERTKGHGYTKTGAAASPLIVAWC